MKISVSALLILFSLSLRAECTFRPNYKKIVSLSGPVTVVLKEFNLLQHPALQGISVFNPISSKEFKKDIYPGGAFLSHASLGKLQDAVVFYDESRELHRVFHSQSGMTSVELKTRNLLPMEAIDATLKIVSPYVVGCDEKVAALKSKALLVQNEMLKKIPDNLSVVFYLGSFRNDRAPELVIVNDGVVKLLIQQKKIKTYPSELAYVNWSVKLMNTMPANTLHVAVEDSAMKGLKEIKRSSRKTTLIYPGALVPGLTQLEAFYYWASSL